jgi:hypothetical protein
MRRAVILLLVLAAAGLAVGYLVFARTEGGYVSPRALLPSGNVLDRLVKQVTGIERMRRNVLASGAVGAALGVVAALALRRPGRRQKRRPRR